VVAHAEEFDRIFSPPDRFLIHLKCNTGHTLRRNRPLGCIVSTVAAGRREEEASCGPRFEPLGSRLELSDGRWSGSFSMRVPQGSTVASPFPSGNSGGGQRSSRCGNERFLCKFYEDKDFRGGVLEYAAQGNPQSDNEIAKNRRFRTRTSPHFSPAFCCGWRAPQIENPAGHGTSPPSPRKLVRNAG